MESLEYVEWPRWKVHEKPTNKDYLKIKLFVMK